MHVDRLEIGVVGAAAGISLSLLLVQVLHARPLSFMTHGGVSMVLGMGLNLSFWLVSLAVGFPQVISVVASPAAHDWMYFGLLPPIIFEAGFSMRKRGFFDNIVPILLYAVAGTLIATFAAGAMLFSLVAMGFLSSGLTMGHCLLFAALISPTDPVASLSVLRELHAPPVLRNCIFGEATLNDALSIVVFHVIRRHYHTLDSAKEAARAATAMARELTWATAGSVVTGLALGLSAAYLTRRISLLRLLREHNHVAPDAELALLSTVALLTFASAERFGFSGIASIFVCGILTRHYTYHNLSKAAQSMADTHYATIALLCENALATMLGVAAFDYLARLDPSHMPLAVLSVPVLFIARALNIFPLSIICNRLRRGRALFRTSHIKPLVALHASTLSLPPNYLCLHALSMRSLFSVLHMITRPLCSVSLGVCFTLLQNTGKSRKPPINWRMQVAMWFTGMRGALCFGLVITLDDDRITDPLPPVMYHLLVSATLATIVFTTLFMAPLTRPLIRGLELTSDSAPSHMPNPLTCVANSLEAALLTDALYDTYGAANEPIRTFDISHPEISTLIARSQTPPPFYPMITQDQTLSPPSFWSPPAPPPATGRSKCLPLTNPAGRSCSVDSSGSPRSARGTVLSPDEDDDEARQPDREQAPTPKVRQVSPIYRSFRRFEASRMKPIFGGSKPRREGSHQAPV